MSPKPFQDLSLVSEFIVVIKDLLNVNDLRA